MSQAEGGGEGGPAPTESPADCSGAPRLAAAIIGAEGRAMLFERRYWPEPVTDRLHRAAIWLVLSSAAVSLTGMTTAFMMEGNLPLWPPFNWLQGAGKPLPGINMPADYAWYAARVLHAAILPLPFIILMCVMMNPVFSRRTNMVATAVILALYAAAVIFAAYAHLIGEEAPHLYRTGWVLPIVWRFFSFWEWWLLAIFVSLTGVGALFCLDAIRGLAWSGKLLAVPLFWALIAASWEVARMTWGLYDGVYWGPASMGQAVLAVIFFAGIYGYVWNVKVYEVERSGKEKAGDGSPAPSHSAP